MGFSANLRLTDEGQLIKNKTLAGTGKLNFCAGAEGVIISRFAIVSKL